MKKKYRIKEEAKQYFAEYLRDKVGTISEWESSYIYLYALELVTEKE